MVDYAEIIKILFTAALTLTGLLLPIMGILIPIYLKADEGKWKTKYRYILLLLGTAFLFGICTNLLSFLYLVGVFCSYFSSIAACLTLIMFLVELVLLGISGIMLISILV